MAKGNQTINVRTWSKTVPAYGLRLRDLDLYVVKNHDELVRALGFERVAGRPSRLRWALSMVFVFALIGGVSTVGGPIFTTHGGRTTPIGTADPLDNDLGVPLTSWCFVVVLIGVLMIAGRWLRTDRHRDGLELGYLAATVAFGALAVGQLVSERGVGAFDVPALPVWAAAVLAAFVLAAVLLFSRGRRVPVPNDFRRLGPPDPQRVIRLTAELEPRQRAKLLDERRRAIARLRERGLVDAAEATQLAELPLGASTTIAPDGPGILAADRDWR
ncbi:hypothetical protein [Kribbella sp. NPDC048915]|uniref:hypothetical protein n=1 Tax=Kribbella sp. NPDC048915 TaxID=3155148 RepID=UPI00340BA317